MKKLRRVISKTKMYGFNPWVDQQDSINQIIAETGDKESKVLRKLLDEALIARRRSAAGHEAVERGDGLSETLRAIMELLKTIARHGEVSMCVQDINLALLQETLAEARAGRQIGWQQLTPKLKEQRLSAKQISERFDEDTKRAKNFAYSTANAIKSSQKG